MSHVKDEVGGVERDKSSSVNNSGGDSDREADREETPGATSRFGGSDDPDGDEEDRDSNKGNPTRVC